MSECGFKVGDSVTLHGNWYGPFKIVTVTSVKPWRNKFKITTSDGKEWDSRFGFRWGNNARYYTGDTIHPTKPGDAEEIRRKRALRDLHGFEWKSLSDERLFAVAEILAQHNKEVANGGAQ